MGKGQKYTSKEIYEIIGRYYHMKKALGHQAVCLNESAGLVVDYEGIGMPRGTGISDPTARLAMEKGLIGFMPKHIEEDFKERIEFIDKRMEAAKTLTEKDILEWRLSGMKVIQIAELLGFSEKQVRRILHNIAEKMSEMSVLSESA